jgi:hypothetical protein
MNALRSSMLLVTAVLGFILLSVSVQAYPPAVGILADNRSCTSCHVSNGPWTDEDHTIVDILDVGTKQSLRLEDGSFLIEVPRGEKRTVLTVIGRGASEAEPPRRNAWLYVQPENIENSALSKFASGWDVNLPMACRIVGDKLDGYEGAHITALPMTLRPSDAAQDGELELQIMLTSGDSVKGSADQGLISNYLMKKVVLHVVEP